MCVFWSNLSGAWRNILPTARRRTSLSLLGYVCVCVCVCVSDWWYSVPEINRRFFLKTSFERSLWMMQRMNSFFVGSFPHVPKYFCSILKHIACSFPITWPQLTVHVKCLLFLSALESERFFRGCSNDPLVVRMLLLSASLLPDGCCCLSVTGNKILFRMNLSPPLTTIPGLDVAGHWLGRAVRRTSHQWTSSYGATLNVASWFWRGSSCSYCWGSSNLALLSAHFSVCCIVVGCVATSVCSDVGCVATSVCSDVGCVATSVCSDVGGRTFEHLL